MTRTIQEFRRIDILVSNVGTNVGRSVLALTRDEWNWVFDTNLKGVFFCSQGRSAIHVEAEMGKDHQPNFGHLCNGVSPCQQVLRKQG